MKIIAFDLGATMGWATNDALNSVSHQEFYGTRVERLAAIDIFLRAFCWHQFDIVVYETPLGRGQDATRSLWGIAGILEATVTQANLPILDVAVPTIKKFATGNGMADKLKVIDTARKRFNYKGLNEHEADAICLLHYAMANLEKTAA